jgi:hypothetical protein
MLYFNKTEHKDLIISKKADNFNTPNTIKYFKELTSKQEILVFPAINENCNLDGNENLSPFAGFPKSIK